ncbi:MAG: hypothetical protein AAF607_15350 [Pseudomonadota bacterium]
MSAGPTALNPLISTGISTPFLPDLEGGAGISGIFAPFDLTDPLANRLFPFDTPFGPGSAVAGLSRVTDETPFFGGSFEDFDLLVLANLGETTLRDLQLGIDPTETDPNFLAPLSIASLRTSELFMTLIPADGTFFNFSSNIGSISGERIADNSSITLFGKVPPDPIPLPGAAWLFASALMGTAWTKRSRRNKTCAHEF